MARSTCLRWLLAAAVLGVLGCTSNVVVMDSRHPEAGNPRAGTWTVRSAGPRMGVVYVTGEAADTLEQDYDAGPVLSAFGWQFEFQYNIEDADITGLVELIPLVLGMEQGKFLPSGSALVGLRTGNDWEFVVGPNLSASGIGMTVSVGKTYRAGSLNLPVNFAVVSGDAGLRYSITFGGNLQQ